MWRNLNPNWEALSKINEGDILMVFDTETMGLKPDSKIIEFSAVRYKVTNNHLVYIDEMDEFINPLEPIPEKIIELTGITDELVKDCKDEKWLADKIYTYIETATHWVAHNAPFDLAKLEGMAERCQLTYDVGNVIDSCEMARDLFPKASIGNHKLITIVEYLFPEKEFRFHSSIEDVKATALIFEKMWEMYRLTFSKEDPRDKVAKVESVRLFENKFQKSMKRINLTLSVGEPGDIFYDILKKEWSCKATTKAKRLFADLNMHNIEMQIFKKYPYYKSMDELAKAWLKFRKKSS